MWRFAAAVTILEIGLTAFTATLFTMDGDLGGWSANFAFHFKF